MIRHVRKRTEQHGTQAQMPFLTMFWRILAAIGIGRGIARRTPKFAASKNISSWFYGLLMR